MNSPKYEILPSAHSGEPFGLSSHDDFKKSGSDMMKPKRLRFYLGVLCLMLGPPLMASASSEHHHGFDWNQFVAHIVNAVIFFGALIWLLRKPVNEFFSNRVSNIKRDLEIAEKSREEAKSRLDEIQQKMAGLDQELADIEKQAREDAEKERLRIAAEARSDAERVLQSAQEEIENMRRDAISQLKAFVSEIAIAEAEKVIKASITTADRSKLFQEFSQRLEAQS